MGIQLRRGLPAANRARRHPRVAALQTAHFNSAELENGSAAKGLSGGVGAGVGDWRLELETDLDIEALAYVRTEGFLGSLHDAASARHDRYRGLILATFNPASGRQIGKLRLVTKAL